MVDDTHHTTRVSLTAQYDHPSKARDAAAALEAAGFDKGDVKVVAGASDEILRAQRQSDPYVLQRDEVPPATGTAMGFVVGLLGFGFIGLLTGSGLVNIMGKEAAQAVGPFWAAVIAGGIGGLGLALAGYIFNAPLPLPEPPEHAPGKPDPRTFVSVLTEPGKQAAAGAALSRFEPGLLTEWQADNGEWLPQHTRA